MAAASPPFHHRPQQRPMTSTWALRTHLELGALRGAVPCARLHARHVLWEWQLSDLDESVELIVSELVTNAVQASAGMSSQLPGYEHESLGLPVVWLWLTSNGQEIMIEVGDSSPTIPGRPTARYCTRYVSNNVSIARCNPSAVKRDTNRQQAKRMND